MLNKKSYEVLNRIEHLPGELEIKKHEFYKSINDSPNFMVELLEGKIEINSALIDRICEVYPRVNRNWIENDTGKSLK